MHHQAQLLLVKNSDNPLGTLRFGFEPGFSRFLEADPASTKTHQF